MHKLLERRLLNENCMTISGKTVGENIREAKMMKDQNVVRSVDSPIRKTGTDMILRKLAHPDGAVVKVAGLTVAKFKGRARVSTEKNWRSTLSQGRKSSAATFL